MFPVAPPHPSLIKKDPELLKSIDERISYNQVTSQYIFEDKDNEYQYNFILQDWIPIGSKTVEDVDEQENVETIRRLKKQKLEELKPDSTTKTKTTTAPATTKVNTGVFVSNLPSDVTKSELEEAFGKFGLISEDFKTGEKRIKLYLDSQGNFKGEALVIYYNKESVDLSIQMLDDTLIRVQGEKIKVEPARFDPNHEPVEKRVLTAEEKKLLQDKTQAMKKKLADWGDNSNNNGNSQSSLSKADVIKRKIWEKTVIIENMFRKQELEENPILELELKQDIQEECDKLGIGQDITKISVNDASVIVSVKFNSSELSEKCIAGFRGRFFDGLKLNVKKYAGEKYETSLRANEAENERMDKFGDWLENKA